MGLRLDRALDARTEPTSGVTIAKGGNMVSRRVRARQAEYTGAVRQCLTPFTATPRRLGAKVTAAVEAFARGEIVVVSDDDDRENEGDLFVAANLCTPEKMAFIIRHTLGHRLRAAGARRRAAHAARSDGVRERCAA